MPPPHKTPHLLEMQQFLLLLLKTALLIQQILGHDLAQNAVNDFGMSPKDNFLQQNSLTRDKLVVQT
ncbi:hypothetical protein HMPREF3192_00548 [Atopobium deltae]|uniref:Uncharacterized protein n=1 Tax=Atopobium deltae TaxID=1393034 RepID=A0A133XWB3_9ACTN|nr:hypothetical protein HMPREF3192_00548 [Atopobium deltae]